MTDDLVKRLRDPLWIPNVDASAINKERHEAADEIERLREALRRVRKAICEAPPDIVTDTLWMHDRRGETVVDCIDNALNDDDWDVRDRAALAGEKKDD
jgi:hypothetical protein